MPRGIRITQAQRAEVIEMIEAGMSQVDIYRETGISRDTISKIQDERNVTTPEYLFRSASHIDVERAKKIAEQYRDTDETENGLCQIHNINMYVLNGILKMFNVPKRTPVATDQRTRALNDAVTMYRAGEPMYRIIRATKISNSTIYSELRARGIPMRRNRDGIGDNTNPMREETREEIIARIQKEHPDLLALEGDTIRLIEREDA